MPSWDWNKKLAVWDYHKVLLDKYDQGGSFSSVFMESIKDVKDSRDISIKWDDELSFYGWFYYRDWTSSGLPYLRNGENVYWSQFTFEKLKDAMEFQYRYGGVGNWQKGYQAFVDECNKRRNGE